MATFLEIQNRVKTIIIDLPTAVSNDVPTLVNFAMKKLQDEHNFWVMEEESSTFTTTTGTHVLGTVPANFKEWRGKPFLLHNDGVVRDLGRPNNRKPLDRTYGRTDTTQKGRPHYVTRSKPSDEAGASSFLVYPLSDGLSDYGDGQYRVIVPYWKYLTDLVNDGDTNWFTVNAEEYLTYRAASEGFFMDWDEERAIVWQEKANEKLVQVKNADKRLRVSGVGTLVPYLDVLEPRTQSVDNIEDLY